MSVTILHVTREMKCTTVLIWMNGFQAISLLAHIGLPAKTLAAALAGLLVTQ